MGLNDPVEKELLYHQVLHSLRADHFPVSEKEAVMLAALQAQVELGDCNSNAMDYRAISIHCLPSHLAPIVPHEGITVHHQSLRGMTSPEAKKAFLNLIHSCPMHRATIFDVMQSFTSNWPRVLWFAVDQIGLHLLEHHSKNALCSYEYESILSYCPVLNCLMIITGSDKKQSKVILTTSQTFSMGRMHHDTVNNINSEILTAIPGEATEYLSIDTVLEEDEALQSLGEFLNSLELPGVPPHKLKLKVGVPIMLLRNLEAPRLQWYQALSEECETKRRSRRSHWMCKRRYGFHPEDSYHPNAYHLPLNDCSSSLSWPL